MSNYLLTLFFSFRGSIGRQDFWIAFLFSVFLNLLATAIGTLNNSDTVILTLLPLIIANIWIGLAAMAKRLHDLGFSGWLLIPLIVVANVMIFVFPPLALLVSILFPLFILWLGIAPGKK